MALSHLIWTKSQKKKKSIKSLLHVEIDTVWEKVNGFFTANSLCFQALGSL